MDYTFIVFQDSLKGITWMPQMGADTLEQAIQNIKEGCVAMRAPSEKYMYFIYVRAYTHLPVHGTHYDGYVFKNTVPGSSVEMSMVTHRSGLQYALTHRSSKGWLFTDDIFGDHS